MEQWKVLEKKGVEEQSILGRMSTIFQWAGPIVVTKDGTKGIAYVCGDSAANANTIASAPELLAALKQCRLALLALSEHHAFEDDAPEFNMGGIGYKACSVAIVAINKAEGRVG